MTHSRGSVTRAKMNALIIVLLFSIVGSLAAYNVQRELPYNIGPNDPYAVEVNPNINDEQLQRIFWGSGGSNQVGGNQGFWTKLTNKFPFLENIFGRMELPPQYSVPNVQQQYGIPNVQQQYGVPNVPQQYGLPNYYQPQFYHGQYRQQFLPSARDVAFTDDAVIVTPPQVPIVPRPVPQPAPQPIPVPVPAPEPSPGYQYNIPQHRLELPRK